MTKDKLNFNETVIETGDYIILKKGSVVHSTHPTKSKYTLSRRQKVKFHHTYSDNKDVVWSGSSCYWFWTPKENIEEIIKHD